MYFLLKNMEKGRPDFPSGTGLPDILVIRNYSVPSYVSLRSAQQVRRPAEWLQYILFKNLPSGTGITFFMPHYLESRFKIPYTKQELKVCT